MECENVTAIGLRIAQLREEKGYSQKQLSEELEKIGLKVRRETVTQWENGTRNLKTGYIVKLAEIFGVSCDYILRGIEAENVNIFAETGLSNDSIKNLKRLSNITWRYGDITVPNTINALIGSDGFVHLLMAFFDYQAEVKQLVTDERDYIRERLEQYGEHLPKGMTTMSYAAYRAVEEHDSDARTLLDKREKVRYKLFKLVQALEKIADDYLAQEEDHG